MSQKEKEIMQTFADALPKMSDMDKGYFLGYAEAMVNLKKDSTEESDGNAESDTGPD